MSDDKTKDLSAFLAELAEALKPKAEERYPVVEGLVKDLKKFFETKEQEGVRVEEAVFAAMECAVVMAYALKLGNRAKARDMLSNLMDTLFDVTEKGVLNKPELRDLLDQADNAMRRGDFETFNRVVAAAKELRQRKEAERAAK